LVKINYYAEKFGKSMNLSAENIALLLEKREAAGLDPKSRNKNIVAEKMDSTNKTSSSLEVISKIIAEEIKNIIKD